MDIAKLREVVWRLFESKESKKSEPSRSWSGHLPTASSSWYRPKPCPPRQQESWLQSLAQRSSSHAPRPPFSAPPPLSVGLQPKSIGHSPKLRLQQLGFQCSFDLKTLVIRLKKLALIHQFLLFARPYHLRLLSLILGPLFSSLSPLFDLSSLLLGFLSPALSLL